MAETLEAFEGWEEGVELFGTPVVEDESSVKGVSEEKKDTEDRPDKVEEDKEEPTPEEIDLFATDSEEETESFEEDTEDTQEETETVSKKTATTPEPISILKGLKNVGLLDLDEIPDDIDETEARDLLEDSYESSLNNRLKTMIEDLDPEAQQIISYAVKGGKVSNLLDKLVEQRINSVDLSSVDLSKEADQAKTMKALLVQEGYDPEVADLQVETLKESNKLKDTVEKRYKTWKERQDDLPQKEVESQEQRNARMKENQRQYRRKIEEALSEKEINGVRFSPKERKELPDYVSKPTVKLESGQRITPLQADIMKAMADPKKTAMLAKLLKGDFDLSKFERQAETKVVKKELEGLRASSDTKKKSTKQMSLADILNV